MPSKLFLSMLENYKKHNGNDPVGYVLSLNLHRRHLSESQRAMVAANISNLEVGANQYQASANLQSQTRAEAAEKLNVSERSVNTAKKVQREGTEELVEAVQEGMSIRLCKKITSSFILHSLYSLFMRQKNSFS